MLRTQGISQPILLGFVDWEANALSQGLTQGYSRSLGQKQD